VEIDLQNILYGKVEADLVVYGLLKALAGAPAHSGGLRRRVSVGLKQRGHGPLYLLRSAATPSPLRDCGIFLFEFAFMYRHNTL
jgi:hypothetical protein